MKSNISFLLATALLAQTLAIHANSRNDVIRGALVGAATGALLSERSRDISASTAIPVLAGVGALTGYAMHHHRHRGYYGYELGWYPAYSIHPYYHPAGYRQRWNRRYYHHQPVHVVPAPQPRQAAPRNPTHARTINRHPGITLIPVTILTPSGFPLSFTITRVGNQYIGPRGETYTEMPTLKMLQYLYKP
jgi:hypothetical protein